MTGRETNRSSRGISRRYIARTYDPCKRHVARTVPIDLRSEIEGIGDEQADPVLLEDDGDKEQLREVQREIEGEERVRVHVERVCPLDGGIGRGHM